MRQLARAASAFLALLTLVSFAPQAIAEVNFRIGKHSNYTRIVFEPLSPGQAQFRVDSNAIEIDASVILPNAALLAGSVAGSDITVAGITDRKIRFESAGHISAFFLEPSRLVIDLHGGDPAISSAPAPAPAPAPVPAPTLDTATSEVPAILLPKPRPLEPVEQANAPPAPVVTQPVLDQPIEEDLVAAPTPEIADLAEFALEPALTIVDEVEALRISGGVDTDNHAFLSLDWGVETPIAVFRRAGALWVLAPTRAARIDADQASLKGSVGRYLSKLDQEPSEQATVLRLGTQKDVPIAIRRAESGWQLIFDHRASSDHAVRIGVDLGLGELAATPIDAWIWFEDPIVGDRVLVAMSSDAATRVHERYRLIDGDLLATDQGLAFAAKTADIEASLEGRRLRLSREQGLRIGPDLLAHLGSANRAPQSAMDDAPAQPATETGFEQTESIGAEQTVASDAAEPNPNSEQVAHQAPRQAVQVNLLNLRGLGEGGMADARRALLRDLQDGLIEPGIDYTLARARLHLAFAMRPEARELVAYARTELGESGGNTADIEASLDIMDAVIANLDATDAASREILSDTRFDQDDEIALWRVLADARLGEWRFDETRFNRVRRILDAYPPALRVRLGTELAEHVLDAGRADPAFVLIHALDTATVDDARNARILRTKGLGFVRDGDPARGLELIDEAIRLMPEYRRHVAIAERARIALDYGLIDAETALAEVSAQRAHWRGHEDEARLLQELGGFHVDAGQPGEALALWRTAIDLGIDDAPLLLSRMRRLYEALVAGDGWQRDPLMALEIVRGYRELHPPDEAGQQIIRNLAAELDAWGLPELANSLYERMTLPSGDTASDGGFGRYLELRAALARDVPASVSEIEAAVLPRESSSIDDDDRAQLIAFDALDTQLRAGESELNEALLALVDSDLRDRLQARRTFTNEPWAAPVIDGVLEPTPVGGGDLAASDIVPLSLASSADWQGAELRPSDQMVIDKIQAEIQEAQDRVAELDALEINTDSL